MSFTFRFSRTCVFTLIAGVLTASCAAASPRPSAASCGAYADKAWYSVQDMMKSGCSEVGDMGPGRFSQSLKQHRDWCMTAATQETMEFEEQERESARASCMNNKLLELVCEDYAKNAVEMSHQYQINRCTTEHHPTGRFDYRFQAHYNWCKYSARGGAPIYSENDARDAELKSCKERQAESRYRPVKKLSVKRTPVEESAPDDESSEERLQVSDAIDPFESGAPYTPVRKLKVKLSTYEETAEYEEPAPRTEKIVVGNRYVEVPAYSNDDDDGRIGDVVKAGAAAAVVGTAAIATGVVAAKAVDYVDDHRYEIKEAASNLKDKLKDRLGGREVTVLKDKIKDKLEGGGGFDRIKDGVGSLKDKLKDRVGGREVTVLKDKLKDRAGNLGKVAGGMKEKLKDGLSRSGSIRNAASGLKEKLKDKLTGGGGLMKGAAKAGGGLLRRLVGR